MALTGEQVPTSMMIISEIRAPAQCPMKKRIGHANKKLEIHFNSIEYNYFNSYCHDIRCVQTYGSIVSDEVS
jgi:hypothetical protein